MGCLRSTTCTCIYGRKLSQGVYLYVESRRLGFGSFNRVWLSIGYADCTVFKLNRFMLLLLRCLASLRCFEVPHCDAKSPVTQHETRHTHRRRLPGRHGCAASLCADALTILNSMYTGTCAPSGPSPTGGPSAQHQRRPGAKFVHSTHPDPRFSPRSDQPRPTRSPSQPPVP